MKLLNAQILSANPAAADSQIKYRIRGSVRNELWNRQSGTVVKIFEKTISGESAQPLATKKNLPNGFFDITYTPPVNEVNGQVKDNFHLVVKYYKPVDNDPAHDQLLGTQTHYNVNRIHWTNYTAGAGAYLGDSNFETIQTTIQKAIGDKNIIDLHETKDDRQVSQLSYQTGLVTDDIMRVILSYRVATSVNKQNPLSPAVFYAFLRQNLPTDLPGDLLRGASDWETIDVMTERAASELIFLSDDIQKQALDNAVAHNLIPRETAANLPNILQELKNQRTNFTLNSRRSA